ncbi:hypothetical protein Tco_0219751, partial [Tanacetum coccineum]
YAGSHGVLNAVHIIMRRLIIGYVSIAKGPAARDCRSSAIPAAPVNAVDARPNQRACYEYGDPNHLKNVCPKLNRESGQSGNQLAFGWRRNDHGGGNQVRGRAYMIRIRIRVGKKDKPRRNPSGNRSWPT